MSRCGPVVPVIDSDDPILPIRGGCVVHAHYAPCPLDGEPASPLPLHGDCVASAEAALNAHRTRTLGQRPLVLHMGSLTDLGPNGQHHNVGTDPEAGCWCDPVIYPAQEIVELAAEHAADMATLCPCGHPYSVHDKERSDGGPPFCNYSLSRRCGCNGLGLEVP